jgi:hypothetical protein
MTELRSRLSFANVMSVLAVFIALGGSAWAIGANSVGTKQIKRNGVRSSDLKDRGVKPVDLADNAVDSAKVANGTLLGEDFASGQLPAGPPGNDATAEPTHILGQPGEPVFLNNWINSDTVNFRPAGFFKDSFGVVHLQGMVEDGTSSQIFQLPAGYTSGKGQYFPASLPNDVAAGEIVVSFNGTVSRNNAVLPSEAISLEGISFRVP